MDKRESQEVKSPLSPAVTTMPGAEREKLAPSKWIASYLSGSDEDDFRKRYFKSKSQLEPCQPQLTKKGSSNPPPTKQLTRVQSYQTRSPSPDPALNPQSCVHQLDDHDEKDEAAKHHDAMVVSRTEDVLRYWTKRTPDDCRLWFIKTLMMKKLFSDSPSIKEQKSSFE
jgi:hypothetical protein